MIVSLFVVIFSVLQKRSQTMYTGVRYNKLGSGSTHGRKPSSGNRTTRISIPADGDDLLEPIVNNSDEEEEDDDDEEQDQEQLGRNNDDNMYGRTDDHGRHGRGDYRDRLEQLQLESNDEIQPKAAGKGRVVPTSHGPRRGTKEHSIRFART